MVRPSWYEDLILEVPHARPAGLQGSSGDRFTREQGGILFKKLITGLATQDPRTTTSAWLKPHALMIAGSHRCSIWDGMEIPNGAANACTKGGYSSSPPLACPASHDYLISDVAHAEENAFHVIHDAVLNRPGSRSIAVQLHTNGSMAGNGRALVSNGTKTPAAPFANSLRFHSALQTAANELGYPLTEEGNVRSCNVDGDYPTQLCGTHNVQAVNTADPQLGCNSPSPASTSDRFIHLEQHTMPTMNDCVSWTAVVARALLGTVWDYDAYEE